MALRRPHMRAERKAVEAERAAVSAVAATAEGEECAAGAQGLLATRARAKERKGASRRHLFREGDASTTLARATADARALVARTEINRVRGRMLLSVTSK